MPDTHYQRLSATDLVFLELENDKLPMHIGAVSIFEGGDLLRRRGDLDIERLQRFVESSLAGNPRLRQRLAYVPVLNHPVWIDDDRFNLAYHVRHTRLPRPGDVPALKRLAGRVMSQRLDRHKPLWELWFVEGLRGGDRFALISKFHHCMIDGISGVDFLASILRLDPGTGVPEPTPWTPRPIPSGASLLADELARRAALPLAVARSVPRLLRERQETFRSLTRTLADLGDAAAANLTVASPTPLNPDVGPHRRFEWARFPLDEVKAIKNRLGGTVNDVVLAIVAGAVGRFLERRGVDVAGLDFRMSMPASVRATDERGALGNRVGVLTIALPVGVRDPRRRLQAIIETTKSLKHSGQLHGVELVAELSDRLFPPLAGYLARLAARARMYNLSVTNIPGPQVPVYLLGARMLEIYPLAFLFSNQALTIGTFSYDGGLYWALTADEVALPDLDRVIAAIASEHRRFGRAAAADRRRRSAR